MADIELALVATVGLFLLLGENEEQDRAVRAELARRERDGDTCHVSDGRVNRQLVTIQL